MTINLRYEVDEETFEVFIFYPDATTPSLRQPDWPDLTPWASYEEAEEWATLYIASVEDELAPYAPSSPGQAGEPKPTEEERDRMRNAIPKLI
jgi:hypothetical protein